MLHKLRYSPNATPAYKAVQMFIILASLISQLPSNSELAAFLVVVCFTAGLNVYATVALLGIFSHLGILSLPPGLHPVENWYVIGVCGILFLVEFFLTKRQQPNW